MIFKTRENISGDELQRGLKAVVVDGVMSYLMGVLTGGVFLVAIGLQLGASNFQIGLLAAIPPLTQLVQLPAVFLIEKIRNRKAVAVFSGLISRCAFLFVALSPLLFSPSAGLLVLIAAVFFSSTFGGIGGCAWNSWMRDLVPENQMGTFFSKRLRIATILGVFMSFAASIFVDLWKKSFPDNQIYAYSGLFLAGFVVGIIGILFLSRTPEPPMAPYEKTNLFKLFIYPFKDMNFKRLMISLSSWSFAVNLAAPFFTVYMLKRLELGMSVIVALSILSQIFNFAFLAIWGKWTDKFSNKSVLAVSGPLFMFSILGWTFTTMPEKYFLTMPILVVIHIIMGIAIAGVTIASGNIALKLAPKGHATAYLATNSLCNSLAAGMAPILGGKFADFFVARNLSLVLKWSSPKRELVFQALNFQHWDFFFGLAFLIGLYALHRLSVVEEQGEVDDEIVRAEFIDVIKRPIRSLSTGAGFFQIISFPFSFVERSIKYVGKVIRK
ncbi:MAG: MFS transporter [Candidatus Omnitrophica bacterium]|nr:MFS transporter [Candidatus Omnitrophota bacterium]